MTQIVPASSNPVPSTILLVDDNPGILYSTSKILTNHQFQITTAKSAAEAMKAVKSHYFDLILCDINMPGRSGLQFLNDLRQFDPTIASVVITANGTVSMAIEAMKCGVLGFVTKPFSEAELLESVNAALIQARLVRETLQMEIYTPMLESLCKALINTMEAVEDSSTGSSQLVAEYSQALAAELGLMPEQVYQIYLAGLFHDIGKIGVNDSIVAKADKLTPEEEKEMQKHPELGARIIEQAPGMEEAARIVRYHHEWYDGKGYPTGLAGENIPLGSRVVAVADVFEELTSNRVYSPALSRNEALAEMLKFSGTQFDPVILGAAAKLFSS
ncbi:MAG TPA: HD domain-containing phosphohydrolase [Chloroflexia bacterium]|nr:HD domain-containing phosphohydrolase [Chloroflexia bacterium]